MSDAISKIPNNTKPANYRFSGAVFLREIDTIGNPSETLVQEIAPHLERDTPRPVATISILESESAIASKEMTGHLENEPPLVLSSWENRRRLLSIYWRILPREDKQKRSDPVQLTRRNSLEKRAGIFFLWRRLANSSRLA